MYVIEMLNITKRFPGIVANDNVTLQLKKGEIHALLGENGAGKSTLMNILFGLYQPEEGKILVNGEEVTIRNPNDANDLKIGMVHQHFKLVHNYTVVENIVLGKEDTKYGFVSLKEATKKIVELSEAYKLRIDPNALIQDISVGMQQRVEILKMLYRDAEILIFDEPTAVLTPQEIEELMKIMKDLVNEGKSIIIITHKLNEIKQIADRCTILRKGQYIGTVDVETTSIEEMAEMMVGRQVSFKIDKKPPVLGEEVLNVSNLNVFNQILDRYDVKDLSLNVRSGEIVVVAGIEGNGQTQLAEAITGLRAIESGQIMLNGVDITKDSIRHRTIKGMSHVPEDRHKFGLVLDYTLAENLVLQTYFEPMFQNRGFIKEYAVNAYSEMLIQDFDIRSPLGRKSIVRLMSGGNEQKAIIAREFSRDSDLIIAVQPTRGLDVGAIEYIHGKLIEIRDQGGAVLVISLELDEVFNLADRIIVMYEGEVVGELDPNTTTENELGLYMSGSKRS